MHKRALLDAPPRDTLKGMRDRAIIATLLYHGIRREELCRFRIKDMHSREGVIHFQIHGKRDKIRYLPINPLAQRLIDNYLHHAGHGQNETDPLFQPINNNRLGTLNKPLNPNSIYQNIIRHYARLTKLDAAVKGLCVHSMRATAATNALQNNADIYRHHAALRPPHDPPRRQPYVSNQILTAVTQPEDHCHEEKDTPYTGREKKPRQEKTAHQRKDSNA